MFKADNMESASCLLQVPPTGCKGLEPWCFYPHSGGPVGFLKHKDESKDEPQLAQSFRNIAAHIWLRCVAQT